MSSCLAALFLLALAAKPIDATDAAQPVFCSDEKQESGYIDLPNRVDTHYFYWYFESRNDPSSDPLLVWIPGGPGMGGSFGMLAENGPCSVNDDLSTSVNLFSWTTQANMVWIDLPANAGFSYSGAAEDDEFTDDRAAESAFWFIQGFFQKHRELLGREIFLVGESYGGHFVPSVAHYIWRKQQEHLDSLSCTRSSFIPINLQGIAIGNGLTDPTEVYPRQGEMVVNPYNIVIANATQQAAIQAAASECRDRMATCQTNSTACQEAGTFCLATQYLPLLQAHRSPYDIRQECETSASSAIECLLKVSNIKRYLDSPALRKFLGVHPSLSEWALLNYTINSKFFGAPSYPGFKSVTPMVADLLDAGVRVLLYAGDADLLCNFYATEATAEKLNWSGAEGFKAAATGSYSTTSGIVDVGSVRSYSRLTFMVIHNAGHMVPGDQPQVALDMISKFIGHEEF